MPQKLRLTRKNLKPIKFRAKQSANNKPIEIKTESITSSSLTKITNNEQTIINVTNSNLKRVKQLQIDLNNTLQIIKLKSSLIEILQTNQINLLKTIKHLEIFNQICIKTNDSTTDNNQETLFKIKYESMLNFSKQEASSYLRDILINTEYSNCFSIDKLQKLIYNLETELKNVLAYLESKSNEIRQLTENENILLNRLDRLNDLLIKSESVCFKFNFNKNKTNSETVNII